jgi:hypothetical protein
MAGAAKRKEVQEWGEVERHQWMMHGIVLVTESGQTLVVGRGVQGLGEG